MIIAELLVQKASLTLFLKEQYGRYEKRILDAVSINSDLENSLLEIQEISQKLSALNEEIKTDPNVTQLKEIIAAASQRRSTLDEAIYSLPLTARAFVILTRELARAINDVVKTLVGTK